MVSIYLVVIILANLSVKLFGPSITIINAFVFIGLDLTIRDLLHEKWKSNIWLKMGLLIGAGSFISWVLNRDTQLIAIASFVAFIGAGVVDTLVYQILKDKSRLLKINGSNIFSSITDSVIFLSVAFGLPLLWSIAIWQILAKISSGFIWSLVLRKSNVKS